MTFLFPTLLTFGLPLVAAPILLHLLHLQRQQRVEWAAMEFLLESDRRNRRWVNLREWLLLAARVLVMALAAVMLAGPQLVDRLSSLFASGGHHVVILDDSCSMAARQGGGSVWASAQQVVGDVIASASERGDACVSLYRTSTPEAPPLVAQGPSELESLAARVQGIEPSYSAAQPGPALRFAAAQLQEGAADGRTIAYLVSDFRTRNVTPQDRLAEPLRELAATASSARLVACADGGASNVAITGLRLLSGPRVAGLELAAEVTVANFAEQAVANLAVSLESDDRPLPAVVFESIPAGENVSASFPVRFEGAGEHTLRAMLEPDTLAADNQWLLATNLPEERRVVLVEAAPESTEGLAFAAALRPAGVATGWQPRRMLAAGLTDPGALEGAAAVLLLDPPRLPAAAVEQLTRFAEDGGGVLMVFGPDANRRFYNRSLLAEAENPLLPLILGKPTQAPPALAGSSAASAGDIVVEKHPVLRVFEGDRNSFLRSLNVNYFRAARVKPKVDPKPRTLATLRGVYPLLVEHGDADRRVMALLSTTARRRDASEGWSNLALSPVYPVLVNELAGWLSDLRSAPTETTVGQPWATLRVRNLVDGGVVAAVVDSSRSDEGTRLVEGDNSPTAPGLYRVFADAAALSESRLVAANVDSAESDLAGLTPEQIQEQFADLGVAVDTPAQFRRARRDESSGAVGRAVAGALLVTLLLERLLALQCSYLAPAPRGAAA